MRYKRQVLLVLWYIIGLVFVYFASISSRLDHDLRNPISQIYYISSLLLWFATYIYWPLNLTSGYVLGLKKKLSNHYPQIDSSEFDFEKFEENKSKKKRTNYLFFLFHPISCLIVCTPFLYFVLNNQFELKVLFGSFAHIAILLLFLPSSIESIIAQFLFMRHLDRITNI